MFENLDIPLATKVLEFAEKRQADFTHNQGVFYSTQVQDTENENECGTAACLAGITCLLSPEVELRTADEFGRYTVPGQIGQELSPFCNGQWSDWDDEAQRVLGLTESQAVNLFYTMNNDRALNLLRSYIQQAEEEQNQGSTKNG